jgi:hypothetical protein
MPKPKGNKKRQILKAKIGFISLCPAGANTIHTVYKGDGGNKNIELATLSKDMTEKGELTCVVYAPDMVDSQGDTATAEVIKDFAYDFAQKGGNIDIRHNEEPLSKEDIFIAESTIIQKDDSRFADMKDYNGDPVDVTGGWGVILKVENEDLRELYRSGDWGGISMGGMMLAKDTSIEAKALKLLEKILSPLSKLKRQETDMPFTEKDLKDVAIVVNKTLDDREEATAKKTKEAAEKLAKEKKEKGEEKKLGLGYTAPVLKDGANDEDRAKHLKQLMMFDLSKKVDPESATDTFAFEEKCREIAKSTDLNKTMQKQQGASFERFFKTNQDTGDVARTFSASDDEVGDAILQDMAKEDEAAQIKLSA